MSGNEASHTHRLHLTILVDGFPKEDDYPSEQKVREVIRSLLPEGERQNCDQYKLSNREKIVLDPLKSLMENGVKDLETLSLTKKDGGGGSGDCRPSTY